MKTISIHLTQPLPILRLTNATTSLTLSMTDGAEIVLFYLRSADQDNRNENRNEHRNKVIDLFYSMQTPSSPAKPDAVAPLTNDETIEPDRQSATDAAAATSPSSPMIPTSEIRTNVSV